MNTYSPVAARSKLIALAAAHEIQTPCTATERDCKNVAVAAIAAGDFRTWTKRISRGDETAFTEFYEQYSLRLYRQILTLTNGQEAAASEILQSAVLKLARRFQVFDDEAHMWSWLNRLVRNACVDYWRAQQRGHRFVPLEAYADQFVDGLGEDHRLAESLNGALAQLSEEERELMRAAYVDRCPLQELAEATGQTYKALESRLGRLRQKLKTKLLAQLRHENNR